MINDHIVQTILMLQRLPYPKHLQGVPEIAGGHHERMDGQGYPEAWMLLSFLFQLELWRLPMCLKR